jgi:hypothetical protein
MLNWGIIRHPMNWLTVLLMLAIFGFALHLAGDLHLAHNSPNS